MSCTTTSVLLIIHCLGLYFIFTVNSIVQNSGLINPRRACAARVTVVGVCVSVCPRLFSHYRLRGGLRVIPNASVLQVHEN